MPKQRAFQKIQIRLVRELEKKFSGKHVVFVGERKILPKPTRNTRNPLKQKRPRSRTLTSVYDAILEDLVFPAEIVGKRVRVKLDGTQLIKVHLDKNQQTTIEHKVSVPSMWTILSQYLAIFLFDFSVIPNRLIHLQQFTRSWLVAM